MRDYDCPEICTIPSAERNSSAARLPVIVISLTSECRYDEAGHRPYIMDSTKVTKYDCPKLSSIVRRELFIRWPSNPPPRSEIGHGLYHLGSACFILGRKRARLS